MTVYDNVLPVAGVDAEMLAAEFWIDKTDNADKLLCTPAGINAVNRKLLAALPQIMCDLRRFPDRVPRAVVREKIDSYDQLAEKPLYADGKLLDKDDWRNLFCGKNLDGLADSEIETRYALATQRIDVRSFPTDIFACREPADYPVVDRFQETHAEPGQPLLVLHTSRDGEWSFVQLFNYCGWVKTAGIACYAKLQWDEYLDNYEKRFLLVTGKRLLVTAGYPSDSQPVLLSMGAKLPLWYGKKQTVIDGRNVCGNHVVAIPFRQPDGSGGIRPLLIPAYGDVRCGYLPYTAANVIGQAFKLQGECYGWGGLYGSWDCSGLIMACYLSFGFLLPRNCAVDEQYAALADSVEFSEDDDGVARCAKMLKVAPGSAVFSDGHVMMYLGRNGAAHYVIHSTSGGLDEHGNVLNCILVANLCSGVPGKKPLIERVFGAGKFY